MKKTVSIILTLVVMLSLSLCLTACKEPVKEEKADLVKMDVETWSTFAISFHRWSGQINYKGENLTCESKSYYAECLTELYEGRLYVGWNPYLGFDEENKYQWCFNDYCSFIIREDNHIVGYAVVNYYSDDEGNNYNYKVLASYVFPKVNGKFQYVTLKYVNSEIDKVIQ